MFRSEMRSGIKRAVFSLSLGLSTIVVTGGIIYGLFRVALYDKIVYGILFACAAGGLAAFAVYRASSARRLKPLAARCARSLMGIFVVLLLVSGVVICAALIVRMPLIGSLCVLPLGLFYYLLYRIRIFKRIRSFASGEDRKDG